MEIDCEHSSLSGQSRQASIEDRPREKKMKPNEVLEYDCLLNELADHLGLARHPDSLLLLKSARILIENLSGGPRHGEDISVEDGTEGSKKIKTLSSCDDSKTQSVIRRNFTLEDISLPKLLMKQQEGGRQWSDEPADLVASFERAARALKLLYLDDQKQLQNQVNETIALIQSITANPKTDPRLLATGR